jgi:hypothetical protein
MIYALLILFAAFWMFVLWRFYQAAEYFSERSLQRALDARQQRDT